MRFIFVLYNQKELLKLLYYYFFSNLFTSWKNGIMWS